ncbi:MAG: hypothetical protein U0235_10245 [Polyangiaceae bacterium]
MLLLGGRVAIAGAFAFLAAQACGSDEATPATPIASDGGDPGQPSSGDGSTACKSNCESADAQPPSGDCTAAMVSAAPFAGGDGSPSSPFQICSVAQWLRINDGLAKSYVLLTDLDFVANPVEGESLEEVRVGHQNGFSGTLDGKGHTIKNLRITGAVSMPQGLFTQISASGDVRNIGITDAVVTSTYADAGILAGRLTGKATNVHVTGKVKGTSQVGGLAGSVDGTVEGASSVADVEGTDSVGGLVGYFGGVALRRSSSAGVVKGTGTSIQNNGPATGGLVGTHRGGPIQDVFDRDRHRTHGGRRARRVDVRGR